MDISGKITVSVVIVIAMLAILNIGMVLADRILVATTLSQEQIEQLQHDPSFFISLGNHLYRAGNPQAAIKLYNMALDFDNSNIAALQNLATLYHEQKEYALAISELEKLIEIDGSNPSHHYDLAINLADMSREKGIYADKEELDRAISEFEKADSLSADFMKSKENIIVLHNVKRALGFE